MTFFPQIRFLSDLFLFTRLGLSISCASSCARQRAGYVRFGVCGVSFQCTTIKRKINHALTTW